MKRKTTEEFIRQSKEINGDKYDYSKTVYINARTKVIITCKIHGDFLQNPNLHISQKCGCPKCHQPNRNISLEELNNKIDKIFNGNITIKQFNGFDKQVTAECKLHGVFTTYAEHLLKGYACKKCSVLKKTKTTDKFIEEAKQVHGEYYDYSLTKYINNLIDVKIICPKHGMFEQNPITHLRSGCPYCNLSKGEEKIRNWLLNKNIQFEEQYSFKKLKYKNKLRFDFYIPSKNILLEYQGIQHYQPIEYFGGVKVFEENKIRDKLKKEYCKNNNLILEEISYIDNIEERLNNIFI